ncbi:MAG: leucine-rich repeat protein [Bacteroidales bacterium]|nr:leucine-rich repeat protein [Bacteroidales bacterium]
MKQNKSAQKSATKVIILILAVFGMSFSLYSQHTLTDDDVVVEGGVIKSCSYNFVQKEIIIPDTLDGQKVIAIAGESDSYEGVFYDKGITSLVLPSTLERIGSYAFSSNEIWEINLLSCTALRSIGTGAFEYNSLNYLDLRLCKVLETIDSYAFDCNMISIVYFPSSLVTIGECAFSFNMIGWMNISQCTALTSIGMEAFVCNLLTSLDLSGCTNLVEIGMGAFDGMELTGFTLPEPVDGCYVINYWEDWDGINYLPGETVTDLYSSYTANMTQFTNKYFYAEHLNVSENADIDLMFNPLKDKQIEVTSMTFSNNSFTIGQSFPLTVTAGDTPFTIPVQLTSPETNLYSTGYEISYKYDGEVKSCSDSLDVAIIIDDDTELGYIGKQAIEAYNASVNTNEIATMNNSGVIYRLLGEYDQAEKCFNDAVNHALEQYYGFTGIKMNQGVVQSDKNNSPAAMDNYNSALTDLYGEEESSAIAPRILYNQAWEHYNLGAYGESKTKALATINHDKSNDYLKAKAYVLLGLNNAAQGDTLYAIGRFQDAINTAPGSCIAALANTNILMFPDYFTGLETSEENYFHIYPNPGNGNFTLVLNNNPGKTIDIKVVDMTGHCIYDERIDQKKTRNEIQMGHVAAGVYLLVIQLDNKKYFKKIVVYQN